jgi:predicted nucleic acid-binding protein
MNAVSSARRALLDTSAYYALTDQTEHTHETARAIQGFLVAYRFRLFTTNLILAETHALLLSRLGYHVALRVLTEIDQSRTTLIRPSSADERAARVLLAKYDEKDFSLTDAIRFVVMDRLRIAQAFTFDRNFTQYGFVPLMPS